MTNLWKFFWSILLHFFSSWKCPSALSTAVKQKSHRADNKCKQNCLHSVVLPGRKNQTQLIVIPRLQTKGEKDGGCKLTIAIKEQRRTLLTLKSLETYTQFKRTWTSEFKIKSRKLKKKKKKSILNYLISTEVSSGKKDFGVKCAL